MVIVHLYGQACNMEKAIYYSKKCKIPIIEDCSQAAGARDKNFKVGSIGLLGCQFFSYKKSRNLW